MSEITRRNGRRRETPIYEKDLKELNSIRVQQWKKMQSYSVHFTRGYGENSAKNRVFMGKLRHTALFGET